MVFSGGTEAVGGQGTLCADVARAENGELVVWRGGGASGEKRGESEDW